MEIRIIQKPIQRAELAKIAQEQFGEFVKAVVDVGREIMAVGGELHADEEALLMEQGSRRAETWGINLYPDKFNEDWIEFDSMVNLKPSQGNRSRGVDSPEIRAKIREIVNKLIK